MRLAELFSITFGVDVDTLMTETEIKELFKSS